MRRRWTLFLAIVGSGGLWRIIRGPLSGPVASTAVSPATAPGLTGRPRAFPQKSARAAGSAQSMVRAATLRLTVVGIISSSFFSALAFLQVEVTEESIVYPVREESRGH